MKILHISQIGRLKEGIGSVLYKLVPLQRELQNQVKVISVFKNEVYPDFSVEHVESEGEFCKIIDSFVPDIVIFHSVYYMPYIHFYRVLLNRQIPYLIQMHGALSKQNYAKSRLKKWIANKLFFNKFLKNARAIVYLNPAERKSCIVNSLNPSSLIIPNGCDNVQFLSLNKAPKLPLDILYIGRIDMIHKGNDKLIEAMQILKSEGYNKCKVTVYANPNDPDLPIFKKQIANMEDLIEYKGGIYGDEKERRLREADLFILTSRYEGMPMGVLEALSYGIPCIITPGTNMADEIDDIKAGWVSPLDSSQIAQTIKKAVEKYSEESDQFRVNAYNLSKEYDWEKIARDSVHSYQSFLSNTEK